MRHRVYGKILGRNKNERDALFKSLVHSLLTYGTIETSEQKAKAVKGLVDKIINLAKSKNRRRLLQMYLPNKDLEERLVKEIAPKLDDRVSGYTSLIRLGERLGDRSMRVRMSIIHNEQLKPIERKTSSIKPITDKKKTEAIKKVVRKGKTGQPVRKTRVARKERSRLSKTK